MAIKNKTFVVFLILCFFFFLLRIVNLDQLPIFNDESTYIRYGLHQLYEPGHQPYSLLIGKEPLLPFLYAFVGSAIGNLLIGARLVTIAFGFLTLLGIYQYAKELLGRKAAFFSSILYCIAPYTVFFDRLALLDSAVSTVSIWSLYLTQRLLQKARWQYGLALGFVMGIGLWIKTSDLFYIFLPLISYFVYYVAHGDSSLPKGKIVFVSFLFAILLFLLLFSNPFYAVHMKLQGQYTYPLYTIFLFPFSLWLRNIIDISFWLFFYLTPFLFFLAIVSLVMLNKAKKIWMVFLWFYLPLVYEVLYAKLFTSRHVLLLTVPLFILAGYGLTLLMQKKKIIAMLLGSCIFIWAIYIDSVLLVSPQQYPQLFLGIAKRDALQYVQGYSSGYGVFQAVQFLQNEAEKQHIVVYIRNDHGNPEDAIVMYLDYQPNITVFPLNEATIDSDISKGLHEFSNYPQYFVSRGGYYAGLEKYFVHEKRFLKPDGVDFVGVEQLQTKK